MGDYLFLPDLKSLAMRNFETVNASNCISIYHFAEIYQCEELLSRSRQFIIANFTAVATTNEFLNLSNKEVEMWISIDEIDVRAEENVFEIIVAWIGRDESERKKYFAELFRQVRLVYVSRDFLCSTIATNYHVEANDGCLDRVKGALKLIDSNNFDDLSNPPRKSPAIVVCSEKHLHCYFPREDTWCRLADSSTSNHRNQIASLCHGELYSFSPSIFRSSGISMSQLRRYDLFSNTWTPLPYYGEGHLKQIVVRYGKIYGLVAKPCPECRGRLDGYCWPLRCPECRRYPHTLYQKCVISRYIPESNVWQDITSFISGLRERVCLVAKDNFIYLIGGGVRGERSKYLSDVDRYDFNQNTWDKVADMQEARMLPCGASAHGKIFIAGGNKGGPETCEVYNERSNEWQFIGSLVTRWSLLRSMVCCDGNLYLLGGLHGREYEGATVELYDHDKDKWIKKTKIPFHQYEDTECGFVSACSMGICKKYLWH